MSDRPSQAGQRIRKFTTLCDAAFLPVVAPFGFTRTERYVARDFCKHVYRNGGRYIEVSATTNQRDGPSQCELFIGEGSTTWPESDWNKITLELLAVGSLAARDADFRYPIVSINSIEHVLLKMSADLARDGTSFLEGNLREFKRLRAELAASRKPYSVHAADPSGAYVSSADPVSAELRRRYMDQG